MTAKKSMLTLAGPHAHDGRGEQTASAADAGNGDVSPGKASPAHELRADRREARTGEFYQSPRERLDAADERDVTADARDREALARDQAAAARPHAQATADRALETDARRAAAEDREYAARDRWRAFLDREALAHQIALGEADPLSRARALGAHLAAIAVSDQLARAHALGTHLGDLDRELDRQRMAGGVRLESGDGEEAVTRTPRPLAAAIDRRRVMVLVVTWLGVVLLSWLPVVAVMLVR